MNEKLAEIKAWANECLPESSRRTMIALLDVAEHAFDWRYCCGEDNDDSLRWAIGNLMLALGELEESFS